MELKIMKKKILIVTEREAKKNQSLSLSLSKISPFGFTLLEVMISLVILSIGLLGLAALTATVIKTNSFSDDFTTATTLAQDKLEELANLSFSNSNLSDRNPANNNSTDFLSIDITPVDKTDYQVPNINQCGTTDCSATSTCTNVSGHCKFTRTTNIWDRTDLSAPDPATRKDIAVIVSWTNDYGNTVKISISTIKSNI